MVTKKTDGTGDVKTKPVTFDSAFGECDVAIQNKGATQLGNNSSPVSFDNVEHVVNKGTSAAQPMGQANEGAAPCKPIPTADSVHNSLKKPNSYANVIQPKASKCKANFRALEAEITCEGAELAIPVTVVN